MGGRYDGWEVVDKREFGVGYGYSKGGACGHENGVLIKDADDDDEEGKSDDAGIFAIRSPYMLVSPPDLALPAVAGCARVPSNAISLPLP